MFNDSVELMTMVITDLAREPDAAAVRELLPVPPRILALGEPTHGRDVLLELRNDLFEGLIEGGDHPTIALESDAIRGLLVDDYITGAGGSLDDVMTHGFSHGFGESAANRELVRRLREFNSTREPGAQVRFAGFDGPLEMEAAASPRQAIHALRDVVTSVVGEEIGGARDEVDELIGEDDRWTDPRIMYDPARSIGRTPEAARLRVLVDDLVALLDANMPALVSHSNGGWYRARMHAIATVGLLRYHHAMADPSAHRMGALLGQRAAIMAANLLMLAERGPVLAFAHNAHLQRPPSSMTMGDRPVRWWSAGAILSARLGDNYRFLAGALGAIEAEGVARPAPTTLEGRLDAIGGTRMLLDSRLLASAFESSPPQARQSPWFGYAPLDPEYLGDIDGIVYVRDA